MKFINQFKLLVIVTGLLLINTACGALHESNNSDKTIITGSGNKVTKNVEISGEFNKISVPSIVNVSVKKGSTNSINIEGSDNLIKYCNVYLNEGTLTISLTKEAQGLRFSKFDIVVYVLAKDIDSVSLSGTGNINLEGNFDVTTLNLDISGTGEIIAPSLNVENLKVNISGTGYAKVKGNCSDAVFSVTGTGDIMADLKISDNLKASIAGTGDIELFGSVNTAEYSVSGTGDIEAKKMIANTVKANSMGTGDIECYATESFTGIKTKVAGIKCYGSPKYYDMQNN